MKDDALKNSDDMIIEDCIVGWYFLGLFPVAIRNLPNSAFLGLCIYIFDWIINAMRAPNDKVCINRENINARGYQLKYSLIKAIKESRSIFTSKYTYNIIMRSCCYWITFKNSADVEIFLKSVKNKTSASIV